MPALRKRSRKWEETHREWGRENCRLWRLANPYDQSKQRDANLRSMYGISSRDYEEMLEFQGGVCAICGGPETVRSRNGEVAPLSVDHDHVTDKVCGLLCRKCNSALGLYDENPERLRVAAAYLERTR